MNSMSKTATKPKAAKPAQSNMGSSMGSMAKKPMKTYDRAAEDMGNMVELGHVNVTVPDQHLATLYYISGLGMTRDPQFGPLLMFGLGGIFVEVMKDVTFHLAPVTQDEAMQMLMGTRSYALLKGARGQAPVDLEAIAAALQRISQLATDYPEITELDINPFIVGEVGTEAYAADARMTLAIPAK